MRYRRNLENAGVFFFTAVTWQRQPLFNSEPGIHALRKAFQLVKEKHPFRINAIVILPEHIHCIWSLPVNDSNYPLRWRLIKTRFTQLYHSQTADLDEKNITARHKKKLWQPRYWEHTIRNEVDLARHIDYIHYNPVKHGLAASAEEWRHSSFGRYVAAGIYPADWAAGPCSLGYDDAE